MAILKICRVNEPVNKIRDFKIFVDGEKVGVIADGETKDFEIADGAHVVKAKIDWCGSSELALTLNNNQPKTLKLSSTFLHSKGILFAILLLFIAHFVCSKKFNFDYLGILFIPVLLYLFYKFFIDRNNYLKLEEM